MIKRCRVCNGRVKYNKEQDKYICTTCGQEYVDNSPESIEKKKLEKAKLEKKEAIKKEKEAIKLEKAKQEEIEKEKKDAKNKISKDNKTDDKLKVEVSKPKKDKKGIIKTVIAWVLTISLCIGGAELFTHYVVSSIEVDGYSMYPTLDDGDKAFTDALFFKMRKMYRFDIVIVKKKSGVLKGEKLIKRVIGLPGETIKYEDSKLYVNGRVIEENFLSDEAKKQTTSIGEFTLGKDEYFVMGDNRGASTDSRYFGAVKKNEIIGRGFLKFMECNKKDPHSHECTGRKFVWFKNVK